MVIPVVFVGTRIFFPLELQLTTRYVTKTITFMLTNLVTAEHACGYGGDGR
jgi:hypothetical protein